MKTTILLDLPDGQSASISIPRCLIPLKSSQIEWVSYEADSVLRVRFRNGGEYVYLSVPVEKLSGLIAAASAGSYLAREIKGKFEYRKVGEDEAA